MDVASSRGISAAGLLLVSALACVAIAATPASASLIGATFDAVYYHPDTSTPYVDAEFTPLTFSVGAGQETDGNVEDATHLLVDFGTDSLLITFDTILVFPTWNNTAFNGVIFTATAPHDIATATVDPSTTMAGFDDTRVAITTDQILVNWAGLPYVDNEFVKVNFTFVPEPASGALLSLGLIGLAARARARA
jgi:hypothetical protein